MRTLSLGLMLLLGCYPVGPALDGEAGVCDESFEDHTAPLDNENARAGPPQQLVIITSLMDPARRTVRQLQPDFYELHDEWSWFRLLNGQVACGSSTDPVDVGESFASVDAIYAWASDQEALPLDLEFTTGGRLYSPSFYALSLRTDPRVYAPGKLIELEAGGFVWELTFVDEPTEAELVAMLEALSSALGPDVFWRPTSPAQEELGGRIAASGSPIADRVLFGGERPPGTVCACTHLDAEGPPLAPLALLVGLLLFAYRLRSMNGPPRRRLNSRPSKPRQLSAVEPWAAPVDGPMRSAAEK